MWSQHWPTGRGVWVGLETVSRVSHRHGNTTGWHSWILFWIWRIITSCGSCVAFQPSWYRRTSSHSEFQHHSLLWPHCHGFRSCKKCLKWIWIQSHSGMHSLVVTLDISYIYWYWLNLYIRKRDRSLILMCVCVCFCRDYVEYWAHRGVEVVAWTINTKVEKDFYQELLKVNYITDSLVEDCDPHY